MTAPLTPAKACRDAADYIEKHGLRQDGLYGLPGERCCILGSLWAAQFDYPAVARDALTLRRAQAVHRARDEIYRSLKGQLSINAWNDALPRETAAAEARALLIRTAERLEAQQ